MMLHALPRRHAPLRGTARAAPSTPRWCAGACATLVVVLVASGCGSRPATPAGTGRGSQASCAEVVNWRGRQYQPLGPLRREPVGMVHLSSATIPGCDDGFGRAPDRSVEALVIPGLDEHVGIAVDGSLAVVHGAAVPTAVRELVQPLPCRTPGHLVGTVFSVADELPTATTAPAGNVLVTSVQPELLRGQGRRYASVQVELTITAGTRIGADDPLRNQRGERTDLHLEASTTCRAGAWVATALTSHA